MLLQTFRRIIHSPGLISELLAKFSIPKQRIVIDFSSPNIAKTFHMGHLRSTVCGDFLQRIYRLAGHEVVSINFLGDWGQQFGLLTAYWMDVMDGMEDRRARPTPDEWAAMGARKRVELLTEAYVAAHRLKAMNPAFAQRARDLQLSMERHFISAGATTPEDMQLDDIRTDDERVRDAFRLWRDFRETSVAYLQDFYARLGTKFDRWDGESNHVVEGARLTDEMIQSDICRLTKDELWAVCQPVVGAGREKITLRKGDGVNLYMNRDLASIYNRHRLYNADKYLYLVDQTQTGHFNQLRQLLRIRGDEELAERVEHVPFGRVIGLATRQGKNDSVDFLIEQGAREADAYVHASKTMRAQPEELDTICQRLSLSTLLYEVVCRHRHSHFTFSFRGSFRPDGSNALILHEKYSRLCSLQNAHREHMERIRALEVDGEWQLSLELREHAQKLARRIQEFDTVVLNAMDKMDPNPVAIYLLKLCNQIGSSMAALRVQDEPLALALPRLMLFSAAKRVLGDGMRLIGIEPIERM
uniref:Probable arginine--tRNA ligase, mitochondrial n=1 Tax=Globodera rostochiensis TaxID=31243 RepID=A0A914HCS4_GLORO